MNILQITKKLPFPLTSGEAWAVTALAEGLHNCGVVLDLFTIYPNRGDNVSNEDEEIRQKLRTRRVYSEVEIVDTIITTSRRGSLENLVSRGSYHADRFDQEKVRKSLESWMQRHRYDVVLVETVYMMHYVRTIKKLNPDIKVILRAHNVEHVIWLRYAEGLGAMKSWYFKDQSKRLKAWEAEVMAQADLVLPVSGHDQDVIKRLLNNNEEVAMLVAPIGMKVADQSKVAKNDIEKKKDSLILGYIGLLDWRPNVEGLQWFLKEVWPDLKKTHLNVELKIAGKNGEDLKLPRSEAVQVIGAVVDSDAFLRSVDVMIAPLLSGSGIRVKILQALRLQVPVISTSIAKEGLALEHRKEILIADTAEEWQASVRFIIGDGPSTSSSLEDMIVQGKQYLVQHHDIDQIAQSVMSAISSL